MTTTLLLTNGWHLDLDENPNGAFVGIEAFAGFLGCHGPDGVSYVVNPEHVVLIYCRRSFSTDNRKAPPLPISESHLDRSTKGEPLR